MNQPIYCPCGSLIAYPQCCGPFHFGDDSPTTAEALMRSRFVAFSLQDSAYLLATWDSATRPARIDFAEDTTQWVRLEIITTDKGLATDTKGTVSFNAYFIQDGREGVMSETSRFRKVADRWFYIDGMVKVASEQISLPKRNELCPCGSGKKYKRCCLK